MLTIFTIPKPFRGHIAVIQRNAITSWTLLRPEPEIIIFGNEEGTAEICRELSLRHIPDVACNEFGTPLLNDVFDQAQQIAKHELMCYVNADIIVMDDLPIAVQRVAGSMDRFLLFSQRWDVDMGQEYDFKRLGWQAELREYAIRSKPPGPLWGLADYFVFPRGLWQNIPPFAVGRTAWDNWLFYRARALRIPIIDATDVVMVIHQKHDYSHHPLNHDVWQGPEAKRNLELAGGSKYAQFALYDATHLLTLSSLKRALGRKYMLRHLEAAPVLYPVLAPLGWLTASWRLSRRAFARMSRFFRRRVAAQS